MMGARAQAMEGAGMFERDERWDLETMDIEPEGGVLWPVLRNIGILMAACLVVAGMLFGIMDDSGGPGPSAQQVRPLPVPAKPSAQIAEQAESDASYELSIPAGKNGHFEVDAQANGQSVRFMVDTGATSIILTEEDARRAGIQPSSLSFSEQIRTANGVIEAARSTVQDIRIGNLAVDDVDVLVIRSPLATSLLGMTFLRRLASYEVVDGRMILRW